jgi:hypothetical protein
VNTYAAPVAWYTGSWAYLDERMSSGAVSMTDQGVKVDRDPGTYLWFADRDVNSAYLKPDYYVCLYRQDLAILVDRLSKPSHAPYGCVNGIVKRAEDNDQQLVRDSLVDQDPNSYRTWAVVKLDWDFPPYLAASAVNPDASRVAMRLDTDSSSDIVQPLYQYAQQDGVPESDTVFRLYAVESDGSDCLLDQATAPQPLKIPLGFRGVLRASVTPHTATRSGMEYFSDPQPVIASATFALPNTQTGGIQHIRAASLEQAEQLATALGTWNVSAGTLGQLTSDPANTQC